MKPSLIVLTVVAVVLAAAGAAHLRAAPRVLQAASPFLPTPPAGGPRQIVIYAHVKSAVAKGARFEVKVDPADYLSGETANRAAIADKVIPPGDVVPNDHYIREEGHKLLTYAVPATARITVITNNATGFRATKISPSELVQIVKGKNPNHRRLFEPKNGFWILLAGDTALSFDQQYSP
ncbi:MAG: hypothetical protein QOE13_920 [Gaiellaceae bacterium]|jgi:hypothetical protein|nr:hypothetical protein [Gaiellaceae bacterium]